MANQEKNCYLAVNGKKYGPVSERDIQVLYNENKITGETKFVREGMTEWIPLNMSGIITSDAGNDGLPPLPRESKSDNSRTVSLMWGVTAALALLTVAALAVIIGVVFNTRTNPAIPVDDVLVQSGEEKTPDTLKTDMPSTEISAEPTIKPGIKAETVDLGNEDDPETTAKIVEEKYKEILVLDKIVMSEGINHTLMIPSSWDFEPDFSGFKINCKDENIQLTTFVLLATDNRHDGNEFIFNDGVIGFYEEVYDYGTFVNFIYPLDNGEDIYFCVGYSYSEDPDWYDENEELIYAMAKTLSFTAVEEDYYAAESIQDRGVAPVGNPVGFPNYIYSREDYLVYLEAVNRLTSAPIPTDMGDGTYRVTIPVGFFEERFTGPPWALQHEVLVSYTLVAGDGGTFFRYPGMVVFEDLPAFVEDQGDTTFKYRERCTECDWISDKVKKSNFYSSTRGVGVVNASLNCPNGHFVYGIIGRINNWAIVGTGLVGATEIN